MGSQISTYDNWQQTNVSKYWGGACKADTTNVMSNCIPKRFL